MSDTAQLKNETSPIDVDIVATTPHVVAFKLWVRRPSDADWVLADSGATGPDGNAHSQLPAVPRKTQMYYWMGIGNVNLPNATYNVLLKLGQDGQPLIGGTIARNGTTNEAGNESLEDWVDLL